MTSFIQQWIGVVWLAFWLVWMIAAIRVKPAVQHQSYGSRVVQTALFALGLWLLFNFWGLIPPTTFDVGIVPARPVWIYLGTALTLAGILFCFWARAVLGRNWSGRVTIKQDHELIQRGPYSFVRHPIYTGLLTAMFGTALLYGLARCFVGVVVCLLALWLKSQTEERFMIQRFGDQYHQYRQRTRALVPFLL